MKTAENKQDERIRVILGDIEERGFNELVERFYQYLKMHLQLPDGVTGIEDFRWEEPYIFGVRPVQEYRQLKKTQPSYRDRYQFLGIERDASSEWVLSDEDIVARVRRVSDGLEFHLGLAELKATDRKSPNHQLLDDYAVWFVNAR